MKRKKWSNSVLAWSKSEINKAEQIVVGFDPDCQILPLQLQLELPDQDKQTLISSKWHCHLYYFLHRLWKHFFFFFSVCLYISLSAVTLLTLAHWTIPHGCNTYFFLSLSLKHAHAHTHIYTFTHIEHELGLRWKTFIKILHFNYRIQSTVKPPSSHKVIFVFKLSEFVICSK